MSIKKEVINRTIFLTQTTYYIYQNEKAMQNDDWFLSTSNKETWNKYKKNGVNWSKKRK